MDSAGALFLPRGEKFLPHVVGEKLFCRAPRLVLLMPDLPTRRDTSMSAGDGVVPTSRFRYVEDDLVRVLAIRFRDAGNREIWWEYASGCWIFVSAAPSF